MDHLAIRISKDAALSYDLQEHASLKWAIKVLQSLLDQESE